MLFTALGERDFPKVVFWRTLEVLVYYRARDVYFVFHKRQTLGRAWAYCRGLFFYRVVEGVHYRFGVLGFIIERGLISRGGGCLQFAVYMVHFLLTFRQTLVILGNNLG